MFRPNRSTELLMCLTLQKWLSALGSHFEMDVIFLDCQKTFDKIDHEIILAKSGETWRTIVLTPSRFRLSA